MTTMMKRSGSVYVCNENCHLWNKNNTPDHHGTIETAALFRVCFRKLGIHHTLDRKTTVDLVDISLN